MHPTGGVGSVPFEGIFSSIKIAEGVGHLPLDAVAPAPSRKTGEDTPLSGRAPVFENCGKRRDQAGFRQSVATVAWRRDPGRLICRCRYSSSHIGGLTKHWIMSRRQQFAYVALPKQSNRHLCLQSGSIPADRA